MGFSLLVTIHLKEFEEIILYVKLCHPNVRIEYENFQVCSVNTKANRVSDL